MRKGWQAPHESSAPVNSQSIMGLSSPGRQYWALPSSPFIEMAVAHLISINIFGRAQRVAHRTGNAALHRVSSPLSDSANRFRNNALLLIFFRPRSHDYQSFNKDVILLPSPTWNKSCKQSTKRMLYQKGHVLNAFEFQKDWDYNTTMSKLQEVFKDRLPSNVKYYDCNIFRALTHLYLKWKHTTLTIIYKKIYMTTRYNVTMGIDTVSTPDTARCNVTRQKTIEL